jgi:hypothetical protein
VWSGVGGRGAAMCAGSCASRSRQMVEREDGYAMRGGDKADGGRGRQSLEWGGMTTGDKGLSGWRSSLSGGCGGGPGSPALPGLGGWGARAF